MKKLLLTIFLALILYLPSFSQITITPWLHVLDRLTAQTVITDSITEKTSGHGIGFGSAVNQWQNLNLKNGKELRLWDAGSSHYTGLKAPALTANQIYTMPEPSFNNGDILQIGATGVWNWAAPSAASAGTADSIRWTGHAMDNDDFWDTDIVYVGWGLEYQTIQSAINSFSGLSADSQATVVILPGNYFENVATATRINLVGIGGVTITGNMTIANDTLEIRNIRLYSNIDGNLCSISASDVRFDNIIFENVSVNDTLISINSSSVKMDNVSSVCNSNNYRNFFSVYGSSFIELDGKTLDARFQIRDDSRVVGSIQTHKYVSNGKGIETFDTAIIDLYVQRMWLYDITTGVERKRGDGFAATYLRAYQESEVYLIHKDVRGSISVADSSHIVLTECFGNGYTYISADGLNGGIVDLYDCNFTFDVDNQVTGLHMFETASDGEGGINVYGGFYYFTSYSGDFQTMGSLAEIDGGCFTAQNATFKDASGDGGYNMMFKLDHCRRSSFINCTFDASAEPLTAFIYFYSRTGTPFYAEFINCSFNAIDTDNFFLLEADDGIGRVMVSTDTMIVSGCENIINKDIDDDGWNFFYNIPRGDMTLITQKYYNVISIGRKFNSFLYADASIPANGSAGDTALVIIDLQYGLSYKTPLICDDLYIFCYAVESTRAALFKVRLHVSYNYDSDTYRFFSVDTLLQRSVYGYWSPPGDIKIESLSNTQVKLEIPNNCTVPMTMRVQAFNSDNIKKLSIDTK